MNKIANAPDISFIVPVFNAGAYLEDAIQSIICQVTIDSGIPLPSIEIVLIDDGSTDLTTLEILEKYEKAPIQNIILLKNVGRKGAAGARNTGIRKATGKWIAFLDADDILFPTSIALRWAVANKSDSIQWIATRFRILRPYTTAANNQYFPELAELIRDTNSSALVCEPQRLHHPLEQFSKSCFTGIMTILVRRSLLFDKGLFEESLPRSEDYHLWMKLSLDQDLYMIENETAFYRIHSSSLTHGNNPKFLHEDDMIKLLMHDNLTPMQRKIIKNRIKIIMQDTCYFYRERAEFKRALVCAINWLKLSPLKIGPWKELVASIIHIR